MRNDDAEKSRSRNETAAADRRFPQNGRDATEPGAARQGAERRWRARGARSAEAGAESGTPSTQPCAAVGAQRGTSPLLLCYVDYLINFVPYALLSLNLWMSFYVLAQSGNLVRRGERGINEKSSADTSAGRLLRRELINPGRGGGQGERGRAETPIDC